MWTAVLACIASVAFVKAPPDRWSMTIGGDLMFNQIPLEAKSLVELEPMLKGATLSILNLEIPLTTAQTITTKKSLADRQAKKQFVLKADPQQVKKLVQAGVDLVSLGNNHAMDFGWQGLKQELDLLNKVGIRHTGAGKDLELAEKPAEFRLPNGAQLRMSSFLSFMADGANNTCWPATSKSAGIASLKFQGAVGEKAKEKIAQVVQKLKNNGGFAVVALHWGIERQTLPTPYQVALGRAFIDAGADVVIGHHPHVLQGAEIYAGKPIFYSLGNCVSVMPASSALFRLEFDKSKLISVKLAPFRISGGKSQLAIGASKSAAVQGFIKLCNQISVRYPSAKSKMLPLSSQ